MSHKRKGIILAGGSGTRLHPITIPISKQLLPVYDKPMIYYPLSTLMLTKIRDIMVISTPHDMPLFQKLLGDGSQWGVNFTYCIQEEPKGIAQALILAEEWLDGAAPTLILGDNIFYGGFIKQTLIEASKKCDEEATIFAYRVQNPRRYGVIEFDKDHKAVSLEEKPEYPKSNYAVPGLYFYDQSAVQRAKNLKPSARGELEITDLNREYLDENRLNVQIIGRGSAWFDAGTHASLLKAASFIAAVEEQQGLKLACPEEIAYRQGWIDDAQYDQIIDGMGASIYRDYLIELRETNFD
jgi:glucose-1-phosphate thymidylyltransferase